MTKNIDTFERNFQSICHYFGSKSFFRKNNQKSEPIFNLKLGKLTESGEIQIIKNMCGDLDILDQSSLNDLINLSKKYQSTFYIYRESTVHNQIFNGRAFPYFDYALKIEFCSDEYIILEYKDVSHSFLTNKINENHGKFIVSSDEIKLFLKEIENEK